MTKRRSQLGKLPRQHTFFLNPYPDERFTRCPKCGRPTRARKKPFVIHIDPRQLLVLNMTGRYCPACDLVILHRDVLEDLLARTFIERDPSGIGNDYLVIGTVERAGRRHMREHPEDFETLFANLHDFEEVVVFKLACGWG